MVQRIHQLSVFTSVSKAMPRHPGGPSWLWETDPPRHLGDKVCTGCQDHRLSVYFFFLPNGDWFFLLKGD
jgi:hypothetical protein